MKIKTKFSIKNIPRDAKIAIVRARFNNNITASLLKWCVKGLEEKNIPKKNIFIFEVPGCVEIPVVAAACAETEKFDCVIALGAVVKGETDHYEYVLKICTEGIRKVALKYIVPVIFGVLTCNKLEHALSRSKDNKTNSGYYSAMAALETVGVLRNVKNIGDK